MRLRPHHLLCTQGYAGKGYSADFTANMNAITAKLRADEKTVIELVFAADDICTYCPKMRGDGTCEDDAKVRSYDAKTADSFCLTEKEYIYGKVVKEIKAQITPEIFEDICGDCGWHSLGLCTKAVLEIYQ